MAGRTFLAPSRGVVGIGAAAREIGTTPGYLRDLDREGRIPMAPRDARGFRRYSPELIEQIRVRMRPKSTPPSRDVRVTARPRSAIRSDIHARFLAVAARAEARAEASLATLRASRPVEHEPWLTSASSARRNLKDRDPLIVRAGDMSDLADYAPPVSLPSPIDDAL